MENIEHLTFNTRRRDFSGVPEPERSRRVHAWWRRLVAVCERDAFVARYFGFGLRGVGGNGRRGAAGTPGGEGAAATTVSGGAWLAQGGRP